MTRNIYPTLPRSDSYNEGRDMVQARRWREEENSGYHDDSYQDYQEGNHPNLQQDRELFQRKTENRTLAEYQTPGYDPINVNKIINQNILRLNGNFGAFIYLSL